MKHADPQIPSSWRQYVKGLCDGCWAGCCTLPVEATGSDLVRLGLATAEEVDWSLEDVAEKLLKKRIIQTYEWKEQLFVLAQVSGRDCIFLHPKTRTCTVYDKRPDVCRKFPKIGPRPGFCPHRSR